MLWSQTSVIFKVVLQDFVSQEDSINCNKNIYLNNVLAKYSQLSTKLDSSRQFQMKAIKLCLLYFCYCDCFFPTWLLNMH